MAYNTLLAFKKITKHHTFAGNGTTVRYKITYNNNNNIKKYKLQANRKTLDYVHAYVVCSINTQTELIGRPR